MSYSIIIHTSTEGYSIEHYSRTVEETTTIMHNTDLLALTFVISNDLHYEIQLIPPGKIRNSQYNLIYVPLQTPCKFIVKNKGVYSSVSIHFAPDYLLQFLPEFLNLERLFKNLKFPHIASRAHLPITEIIKEKIEDILHNNYTGTARDTYMNTKVKDLVLLCLRHIKSITDVLAVSHPQQDIDKVMQAHDFLLSDFEKSCSVSLLSSLVDLDERRLEKLFKRCYGTTVYDFHLCERMRTAKELLKQTDLTVKEIAKIVGYKKATSFSLVFKNKFGYSPRKGRQV